MLHLFCLQDDARYFLVTNTEGQLVAFTHFRCARLQASTVLLCPGTSCSSGSPAAYLAVSDVLLPLRVSLLLPLLLQV